MKKNSACQEGDNRLIVYACNVVKYVDIKEFENLKMKIFDNYAIIDNYMIYRTPLGGQGVKKTGEGART